MYSVSGKPGVWTQTLLFKILLLICLFYFWICWVFGAMWALSLVASSRGCSLLAVCRLLSLAAAFVAQALGHLGFSICNMWLSSCNFWAPDHRLSNCGTWLSCAEAYGIVRNQGWNMSPAFAGGFFTTEPPGKPWKCRLQTNKQKIYFAILFQSNEEVAGSSKNL